MGNPWKTVFPAAILLLIAASFVLLSLWSPRGRGYGPGAGSLEASGLVAAAVSRLAGAVEGFWRGYFGLVAVRAENGRLRAALARQGRLITDLGELRAENARLRRLLDYRERAGSRFRAARIIAWEPGPFYQSVVLGAGSDDGVYLEAAVVTVEGIVGRVTEVSPGFSKVLLLTDLSSGVDAFISRNRVNGLLTGAGPGRLHLDYVRKAEDVRLGDTAVSSGLDGIFPAGLALGTVTFVDKMSMGFFMRVEVSPSVDLATLEEVLVLMDPPAPLDWRELAPDIRAVYEKKARRN
ncbi:MAG: rod shape-determining protein MreC [Deltaproteobacteria bacterium]|jgi:rod shape-determining protein MreC|nr:rod shape-determining protein MreC [Deltaproteobacteria bacterium]